MFLATISGHPWPILNPAPSDVKFKDIAEALAKIPRFSGHTPNYSYSVAQHCVHVSKILERASESLETQLYGLLHDAHEALGLGDIPTPIKQYMMDQGAFNIWKNIQTSCDFAIFEAAGLSAQMPENTFTAVNLADRIALRTEARDLMPHDCQAHFKHLPASKERRIKVKSWPLAMEMFLHRLNELRRDLNLEGAP